MAGRLTTVDGEATQLTVHAEAVCGKLKLLRLFLGGIGVLILNDILIIAQAEGAHIGLPHNMLTRHRKVDIENIHIGMVLRQLPGIAQRLLS